MNESIKITIPFVVASVVFGIILVFVWNDDKQVGRLGLIVAVLALLLTLWYDQYNKAKKSERRKKALTIYKRNLLFKLVGTLHAVYWSLFQYLSYNVSMMYPITLKIGTMTVADFQKYQFENYKLYYDEIKYFTNSEFVPIEIKEELDWLNLDAEKLINFLPVEERKLNHDILFRYIRKVLKVVGWTIDEDSQLRDFASKVLDEVDFLLKLPDFEDAISDEMS